VQENTTQDALPLTFCGCDFMKTLVVYYSRTGHNKTLGEAIAKMLSADIDEIIDKKKRAGRLNWLRAGRDSLSEQETDIQFEKKPGDYDLIIIGSPIWAGRPTPAIRSYLGQNDLKGKKVAFFVCSGGEGYVSALPLFKALTPDSEIIATFGITEKQLKEESYETELKAFVATLK
jgi:flavodoxin